jgi:tetratricopeptide (TPR) repeat protein
LGARNRRTRSVQPSGICAERLDYIADIRIENCTALIESRQESQSNRAAAYYNRGIAWKDKGDLDRAIADFTEAIRLNPKDAVAYHNRGGAWGIKGDPDRAIADCSEAIRLDPKDALAYKNRGIAREMKHSLKLALADFKMHSRLAPSDPDGPKAVERVLKQLSAR